MSTLLYDDSALHFLALFFYKVLATIKHTVASSWYKMIKWWIVIVDAVWINKRLVRKFIGKIKHRMNEVWMIIFKAWLQCRIASLIDILQVSQTDILGMLSCSMLSMIFGCSFLWCFFSPCFLLKLSFTFTCDSFFLFLLTLLLLPFFSFYSHIFTLLTLLPYYLKDYLEGLAVIRQWLLASKFSFFSYFYSFQMLV